MISAPDEIMALAREAGFINTRYVSGAELTRLYFSSRTDGLRLGSAEGMLIATT